MTNFLLCANDLICASRLVIKCFRTLKPTLKASAVARAGVPRSAQGRAGRGRQAADQRGDRAAVRLPQCAPLPCAPWSRLFPGVMLPCNLRALINLDQLRDVRAYLAHRSLQAWIRASGPGYLAYEGGSPLTGMLSGHMFRTVMHVSKCWGLTPDRGLRLSQEIRLLERISHDRNIVQFYGACLQTNPPMEYMGVRAAPCK